MDYTSYKQGREDLEKLIEQSIRIVEESNYDEVAKLSERPSDALKHEENTLRAGDLNTLVLGHFSSGKSAFLNALMGMKLLPTDVRPCTAVIGELKYGPSWDISLYPRDKKQAPINICLDELSEYITIPLGERTTRQNPYSRVVISAPLPVLKQGITLVDSPGLNDPTSHDEVTTAYLPKADAVVYIMSAIQLYDKSDKEMIGTLRHLGHTSIVFVISYIDKLEMDDEMYGSREAEKVRRYCSDVLAPLTDLGENGIFYVNSQAALKGKTDHQEVMLERSHFPKLECGLERILAAEKGKLKLAKSYTVVKNINAKCEEYVSSYLVISSKTSAELKAKVEQHRGPLRDAEKKAADIFETVRTESERVRCQLSGMADAYYKDLTERVTSSLLDENKTPCEHKILLFSPKESTSNFVQDLTGAAKNMMISDVAEWGKGDLGKFIEQFVKTLSSLVSGDLETCLNIANSIKFDMLDIATSDIAVAPSESERVIAAGVALMLGDVYGATMGGIAGIGGMLRTMACEVVAGVALIAVSMVTPVGWALWIGGMVTAAVTGGAWNIKSLSSRVRKKTAEEIRKNLSTQEAKRDFTQGVLTQFDAMVENLRNSLQKQLSEPINQARKMLEEAEQVYSAKSKELQKVQDKFNGLAVKCRCLRSELDSFEKKYFA